MKIVISSILSLFLIGEIISCEVTNTTDYYISKEGNDNNDGSSVEQSWLSIQHALNHLRKTRPKPSCDDHATINILEGLYFQDSVVNFDKRYLHMTYREFELKLGLLKLLLPLHFMVKF